VTGQKYPVSWGGGDRNIRIWGVMGQAKLNLVKLCVGADSVEDLADWQARRLRETGAPHQAHVTRMWPRRAAELVDGGSLYWVIKGFVLARQRILGLEPREGADGVRRCAILLEPEIRRTAAQPRRPFQGWRYLRASDAPRDLVPGAERAELPPDMLAALDGVGVL
jgi:hypothetical protein